MHSCLQYTIGFQYHTAFDELTIYVIISFIQVKYLGEEGENTPVAGAASICSPWDLVVSCWTLSGHYSLKYRYI